MSDQAPDKNSANARLLLEPGQHSPDRPYPQFVVELDGERKLYSAVAESDRVRYRTEA
jgi:hypothetical protein